MQIILIVSMLYYVESFFKIRMKCSLLCDLILSRAGLRNVNKAAKNDHENVINENIVIHIHVDISQGSSFSTA